MSDHHPSPSPPLTPPPAPAAAPVHAVEALPPAVTKKKQQKVRSAWISFSGRIVAQLIGAIATVGLGYALVASQVGRGSHLVVAGSVAPAAGQTPTLAPGQAPAVVRARRVPGTALVVLPFQDFSPEVAPTMLADGLTEAVTAALARSGRVHVTSRTSAMAYKQAARPLPAIAAELGVDLVLEGSIVRQAGRVRVTVQLIDAAADTHIWAQTYDRPAADVLALGTGISEAIESDLAGVLPRRLQSEAPATAATVVLPTPGASSKPSF